MVEVVPAVEPEAENASESTSEEEVDVGERAIAPRDSVEPSVAEGRDDPEPQATVAEPRDDAEPQLIAAEGRDEAEPQDGSPLVEVRGGPGAFLVLRKLESWTPG